MKKMTGKQKTIELTDNLRLNAVQCLQCFRIIVSWDRHDYKTCPCPNKTMVDGGFDYVRYGGVDMSKVSPMHQYYTKDLWEQREAYVNSPEVQERTRKYRKEHMMQVMKMLEEESKKGE